MRTKMTLAVAGLLLAAGCSSAPEMSPVTPLPAATQPSDPYDEGYATGAEKSAALKPGTFITTLEVQTFCTTQGRMQYPDSTSRLKFATGCTDALNRQPRNPR